MSKSLYEACDQAYEGLTREYPWMGGAVIVREDDGFYSAIPGAHLNDISYTSSRDVVIRFDSINDVPGYSPEHDRDAVVDYMEQLASGDE